MEPMRAGATTPPPAIRPLPPIPKSSESNVYRAAFSRPIYVEEEPTEEERTKYPSAQYYSNSDEEIEADDFFKPQVVDRKWTHKKEEIYQATLGYSLSITQGISPGLVSRYQAERMAEIAQVISPVLQINRSRQMDDLLEKASLLNSKERMI